jgi:hypothetical protein
MKKEKRSYLKEAKNIIQVTSPTFFVKRDDPTNVIYSDQHQDLNIWKFVQTSFWGCFPTPKENEILYIYKELEGRGALITPKHLKV